MALRSDERSAIPLEPRDGDAGGGRMTREEAIEVLKNRYYSGVTRSRTDDEWRLATDTAIAALRGPVPDPDTGLMPCGCGGKANVWLSKHPRFTKVIPDYEVGCTECAMTTGWVRGKQENAVKVWNTAMGYKEQ